MNYPNLADRILTFNFRIAALGCEKIGKSDRKEVLRIKANIGKN